MNVVFTGPAYDGAGKSVTRYNLTSACIAKGNIFVQDTVRDTTDILVASRTDTVKAKAAAKRGVAVFTYPEFIERFLPSNKLEDGGKPDKYVDTIDKANLSAYFGPVLEKTVRFGKAETAFIIKDVHDPALIDSL